MKAKALVNGVLTDLDKALQRKDAMTQRKKGWIGVDLDGTLAHYDKWRGIEHIGEPVPAMLERVKVWLAEGREVRIFTARIAEDDPEVFRVVREWCLVHTGHPLPITCVKDFGMIELWDDRCVQIEKNTGRRLDTPVAGDPAKGFEWQELSEGYGRPVYGVQMAPLVRLEVSLYCRKGCHGAETRFLRTPEGEVDADDGFGWHWTLQVWDKFQSAQWVVVKWQDVAGDENDAKRAAEVGYVDWVRTLAHGISPLTQFMPE